MQPETHLHLFGFEKLLYSIELKGFMHMPGKPHRAVQAIAVQMYYQALNFM